MKKQFQVLILMLKFLLLAAFLVAAAAAALYAWYTPGAAQDGYSIHIYQANPRTTWVLQVEEESRER